MELKKLNAVALWSWDIEVDNCAICRNLIMVTYTADGNNRINKLTLGRE